MEPTDYMNALFDAVNKCVSSHLSIDPLPEDSDAVAVTMSARLRDVPLVVTRPSARTLHIRNPDRKYGSLSIEVGARFGNHKRCDIEVSVNGTNYDVKDLPQMSAHLVVLQEMALFAELARDRFFSQNP